MAGHPLLAFLGIIIVAAGIFMAQIMGDFIRDESLAYEFRLWCFKHYGDATRATYTMFEASPVPCLATGWVSRILVAKSM